MLRNKKCSGNWCVSKLKISSVNFPTLEVKNMIWTKKYTFMGKKIFYFKGDVKLLIILVLNLKNSISKKKINKQ